MNNVKIGDMVRLPGFPALLEVESVSGALGTVCWKSSGGETIHSEVFLSQLQPSGRCRRETAESAGEPVPPPFAEENWNLPPDR